ncbi:MAG TPA: protein kinase, partial [Polyangium sp.]|nr:protein kinase [Polyangium sp.]
MIDRYEIIRPLGRGGMGQVLLARDTRLGRLAALKLLTRRGHEQAQRFLVEARATAQVRHDNIVVIYELGEHDSAPYMVLEYLRGKTLRQWLDERSPRHLGRDSDDGLEPVPPGRAVEIMIPVVRALVCAHEYGIVHRDLKPSNILLTDTAGVKVLDFGLAKLLDEPARPPSFDGASTTVTDPREGVVHTATGALLGTLPYMSPEQWLAEPVDHRADIWAVGVILAELVLGRHPLAPLSMLSMANVGLREVPMPSLRELCPGLGALGGTIDRCLIKWAEDRLGSARELLAELSAALPSARPILSAGEEDNPYAGLSAFQESDAGRFFGRARAIMEVTTRLGDQPLIAVVGPSGAGKSSFVRAGVIPALRRSGEAWEALLLRPGPHPLSALAELLLRSGHSSAGDHRETRGGGIDRERDALLDRLRAEPGLLGAEIRARARRRLERVLVFVDQFEELYTLASAEEREAFFACLSGVADDVGSPLRVVIAIRSDFLDRVTEAHAAMTGLGRGLMLLPPMDRAGLSEALVRPLSLLEYRFEPASLVEEMLDTLEHTTGALPLLQFTAEKLWEQRDRGLRALTEESYRRIGGIGGTLAGHADAVLGVMSSEEQRLARVALLRLVTAERTRALATRRELGELCAAPEAMEQVLGRLTDARLLSVEGTGAGATVELVHESLITRWLTLSRWVADNQEDAAFLARLKHAAEAWEANGEAEDLLLRGRVAEDAGRWYAQYRGGLARGEQRFLEASLALAERSQRRRRRVVASVLALSVLVAAGMSYLAWQERAANHVAEQETARAQ